MHPLLAIAGLLMLVAVTAVVAERKAGLPAVARPAKRALFACALAGALGLGWAGYILLGGGPAGWLAAAAALVLAAITGMIRSARAMLRAINR